MDTNDAINVPTQTFAWYDYILFVVVLAISALIGIYVGCFGKKQLTKNDYLMGGKKMKPFPIAISLIASNSTGIILFGLPADVYQYGATFLLESLSLLLLCIVSICIYLPVFYNLATGLSIHLATPIICGICIFYTAIGGLKAVVWTDTLQFLITTGIFVAVFIMGLNSVGGFSVVWQKAVESGRLDIFDFDPDPTKRDSVWIMLIGWTIVSMSYTTVDQTFAQKFLAISNFCDCALSLVYYAIGKALIDVLCILIGLTLYAKYSTCDPLTNKVIETNDQLVPYFVMDVSKDVLGFSGLFVAGIVSVALSSQSAIFNCLAGTIYEDIVSKFVKKDISQEFVSKILKLIVVVTGVICTSMVYIIPYLGDIFPLVVTISGLVCGPILRTFSLGLFFPKVNTKGGFYGGIFGIIFGASIIIPAKYYEMQGYLKYDPKPFDAVNCANDTILRSNTSNWSFNEFLKNSTSNEVPYIFRISFYYYTLLGFLACMVSGLIIGYLTNKNDPPVDKKLISPIVYFWLSKQMGSNQEIHNLDEKEEILNFPATED